MYFNPTFLTFFIAFMSYGFYGAGLLDISFKNISFLGWVYFFMPIVAFVLVSIFEKNSLNYAEYRPIISLKKEFSYYDYIFLVLIATLLFLMSTQYLSNSISNDSYSYASAGLVHVFNVVELLISKFTIFDDYYAHLLFQFVSIILIIGLLLVSIIFFAKNNFSILSKLLILLLLLSACRLAILLLGGNANQHPPMMGFPVLLFSSFLGPSDYSLKLSYFFTYIIFAFIFYFYTKKASNSLVSFIATISILSLPGFLFLSSTVEQSYWAMLCFVLTLILLANAVSYKTIFAIIVVFCFFRSASIFSCLPVALHCIFYNRESNKLYADRFKELLMSATVVILFLPFFLFSLIESPGTSLGRLSFVDGIQSLFIQGNIFKYPLDTFGLYVMVLLIGGALLTLKNRQSQIAVLFLLFLIIIYNLIDTSGYSKYQLEIISPFVIFFAYQMIKTYTKRLHEYAICVVCLCLLYFNIFTIVDFKNRCLEKGNPYDTSRFLYSTKSGCNFVFQPPFDLAPAFKYIREVNGFSNFYLPGLYYGGTLPHVLNKIKISEFKSINLNLENQLNVERKNNIHWTASDAKLLNNNISIDYILIADVQNAESLRDDLLSLNWQIVFFYKTQNFLLPTYVMKRGDSQIKTSLLR